MEKLYVGVHAEIKDGKIFYYLDAANGVSLLDAMSVLVGGLNLTIKGIENPVEQYRTFKKIVHHMENELFNDNSFKDLHIGIQ
jgi:hypothetical protein